MQSFIYYTVFILSMLFVSIAVGQVIHMSDGENISRLPGDELHAQWSSDNKSILFKSINNGNIDLCIYQMELDTIFSISNSDYNFNNPVWHPDGDKIVFDSDKNGIEYLYSIDIKTNEVKPLFNRKIRCRNASFSASSRQVYFAGYDELAERWEIYSYDFIYDNLNKLTSFKLGCSNPEISNDGKLIAYCKENPFNGTKNIDVINWYGEPVISFNEFSAESPMWNTSGFKLYFISKKDNKYGELYSIWKDGSHLVRLTNDTIKIQDISVSSDESNIAISALILNSWDIIIASLD